MGAAPIPKWREEQYRISVGPRGMNYVGTYLHLRGLQPHTVGRYFLQEIHIVHGMEALHLLLRALLGTVHLHLAV